MQTKGWSVEIFAGFEAEPASSAEAYGVQLMSSANLATEATFVGYNTTSKRAYIDLRNSTLGAVGMRWVWTAPLSAQAGHGVALRVYVDRSTIEVFAGQWLPSDGTSWESIKYERMITARAYVSQESSDRIALFSRGAPVLARQAHVFSVGTGEDEVTAPESFHGEGGLGEQPAAGDMRARSVPLKSDDYWQTQVSPQAIPSTT